MSRFKGWKKDNDKERSSSRSDIWACIIFGIIFIFIGKHIHEYISYVGYLCFLVAIYLFIEHDQKFGIGGGSGERAEIPNIYGDPKYPEIPTITEAVAMFRGAGFWNIECKPLGDLKKKSSIWGTDGDVSSVTINGKGINTYTHAPIDAKVVIAYHSLRNKPEETRESMHKETHVNDEIIVEIDTNNTYKKGPDPQNNTQDKAHVMGTSGTISEIYTKQLSGKQRR